MPVQWDSNRLQNQQFFLRDLIRRYPRSPSKLEHNLVYLPIATCLYNGILTFIMILYYFLYLLGDYQNWYKIYTSKIYNLNIPNLNQPGTIIGLNNLQYEKPFLLWNWYLF